MATVRKTITLTDKQDAWIKERVASGDYTNDSEFIRTLVRRDLEEAESLVDLRRALQEGLDSGISDRTVEEIWSEAESRRQIEDG